MASRLSNLSELFSNMRTRTILFATGGVLFLAILIGFLGFRSSTQQAQEQAKVQAPTNIQSVPGLTAATPEYASVQTQLNEQNYQNAVKTQGSAIPTAIGRGGNSQDGGGALSFPGAGGGGQNGAGGAGGVGGAGGAGGAAGVGGAAGAGQGNANGAAGKNAISQKDLEAMQKRYQDQLDAMKNQLAQANAQQNQQQQQQIQSAMQSQAQQLLTSWSGSDSASPQQYVAGQAAQASANTNGDGAKRGAKNQAGGDNDTDENAEQPPVVKAGDIMFGVLGTAVNTDEPGPIMATIVTGPLKGAKLVGSIQPSVSIPGSNGPTKVVLNFNTMSIPSFQNSLSVSAVAIDPDTARTALASKVDHHYLERYGSLFASAFLEGYGQAVQQAGATVTVTPFGGTQTQYSGLTGIQEVTAGLGQVGQQWGNQLGDVLNRPNTIYLDAGIGIGILFLNDVTLDSGTNNSGSPAPVTEASIQASEAPSSEQGSS